MAVTDTTLDGFFKDRYVGKLDNLLPDFQIIANDIAFSEAQKVGDEYVKNVRTRHSNGYTWYGSGLDAFDLNSPISGQTRAAKVRGSQMLLRDVVAYGVTHGSQNTMQAFGNAFDETVEDMFESAAFALEMALLYGGSSVAEVDSITSVGAGAEDIVLDIASWAPGLWAKAEGAEFDVYDAPGGTIVNSNAAVKVVGIDFTTRTLSVTGNATDLGNISATDVLIPRGADTNWFDGMDVLLPKVSGTQHGIPLATNSAFRGNSVPAGGAPLSTAIIDQAASIVSARSGLGKLCLYMSPFTYADLKQEYETLTRFVSDATNTRGSLGFKTIEYQAVTGMVEMKTHPMVKAGEAFLCAPRHLDRIGSTDATFNRGALGMDGEYVTDCADKAGKELRIYWNQGLLNKRPAAHCKITGIVNDSLA